MNNSVRTISPVDGSVCVERPFITRGAADKAVKLAAVAQKSWASLPLQDRILKVGKMIDRLVRQRDTLGQEISWQMGRPIRYTPGEIDGMALRARYMMEIAPEALAEITPAPGNGTGQRKIKHVPLGVILAISPWNYPYLTTVNLLVPALIAGNAVLLKPSPQTPLVGEHFVAAATDILPEGLVQCLHMSQETTLSLISNASIAHVAFTGSVAGGVAVEQAAAGRFIGTGLELGGKDPAYVRADANIELAVEGLVDGSFFNSGQSCCGVERIYVDRKCYDNFIDAFTELTRQYVLGHPLDPATTLGPVVGLAAAERIRGEIAAAINDGAKPLLPTKLFPADNGASTYLAPQILINCRQDMPIVSQETFGPVVAIMAVDNDEEAVTIMNDSAFGLTASIWTRDEALAWEMADRLDAGTVFLNRCDVLDPALAWTGVKNSGRGATLSQLGFDGLTRPKSFNFNTIS